MGTSTSTSTSTSDDVISTTIPPLVSSPLVVTTTMASSGDGDLDYLLNDIDSFIEEGDNWSTVVIAATTTTPQDNKCMLDMSSNSDNPVQRTTNTTHRTD